MRSHGREKMTDAGRPRGVGGAADDVLVALTQRVRELQSKVASLQGELDESQRRLATYEDFDSQIQDALSSALKAAYEIRSRAEDTANQILDQGREERRILMKEVQRLRDERDSLQDEIATLRRGGLAPVPRPAPVVETPSASELRAAAADAMRSVFDEILAEMRSRAAAPPPQFAPPPPSLPAAPEPYTSPAPPAAQYVPPVAPPTPQYVAPAAPPVRQTPPAVAPQAPAVREIPAARETPIMREPPPLREMPITPTPPPAAPTPPPSRTDELAARLTQVEAPAARPAPTMAPTTRDTTIAPEARVIAEPAAPSTEIQLVLSPVPSFPRLVEIERRIQSLAGVRTLYVRDFRNGVATLAVGLRTAMTADEFGAAVRALETPRFHIESIVRNSLELRIETEAQSA